MADDDPFFREVQEQIRQDRAKEIWARYGALIIACAVAIVVAVAGYRGWEYYTTSQVAASGDRFMAAIEASGQGNHEEAARRLEDIAANAGGRYPDLARLRLAGELAARGDHQAAMEAFDAVATTGSAPQSLRDIARLRAGLLAVDLEDFAAVEARLASLAEAGNAFRHAAREALAVSAIKAGEDQRALEWLTMLADDGEAAQNVRARAALLLDLLAGRGVTAEG